MKSNKRINPEEPTDQPKQKPVSPPETKQTLQEFHHYLRLPAPAWLLVSAFLTSYDTHQLNRALVGFYKLFFPISKPQPTTTPAIYRPFSSLLQRQFKRVLPANKLHKVVDYANYQTAQEMIDINPFLMFEKTYYTYRDGHSVYASPLQAAFYNYDTYMWTHFLEKIEQDPQALKLFYQQASEQIHFLDLTPLFAAYEAYTKQRETWGYDEGTDKDLENACRNLGVAQQKTLPVHMWKEFLKVYQFLHLSEFEVKKGYEPIGSDLFDYRDNQWMDLPSLLFEEEWGTSFILMRGSLAIYAHTWPLKDCGEVWDLSEDLSLLRRLYTARKENFEKKLSELETKFLASQIPNIKSPLTNGPS